MRVPWLTVRRGSVLEEWPLASCWSAKTLARADRPDTLVEPWSYDHTITTHLPDTQCSAIITTFIPRSKLTLDYFITYNSLWPVADKICQCISSWAYWWLCHASPSSQQLWSAGFLCGRPCDMELVTRQSERSGHQQRLLQAFTEDVFIFSLLVYIAY